MKVDNSNRGGDVIRILVAMPALVRRNGLGDTTPTDCVLGARANIVSTKSLESVEIVLRVIGMAEHLASAAHGKLLEKNAVVRKRVNAGPCLH